MKHHDKSKLGRKGFIWPTLQYCCSFLKEVRTGTKIGQDLEVRAVAETTETAATGLLPKAYSVHLLEGPTAQG